MIKIIDGDLLDSNAEIIAHQVNCMGVMGSGLAKQIKEKYPIVYEQYKLMCDTYFSNDLLGNCQFVVMDNGFIVANLFGQLNYGRNKNVTYTSYYALRKALFQLKKRAQEGSYSVALPFGLGSGLDNGDWKTINKIIDEVFHDYEVTLYKYNKQI